LFLLELQTKFNDPDSDKIRALKRKVEEVKDVMLDNVDKILQNITKAEDILEMTNDLREHADEFRGRTVQTKRNAKYQMYFLIFALVCIVAAIVVGAIIILLLFLRRFLLDWTSDQVPVCCALFM